MRFFKLTVCVLFFSALAACGDPPSPVDGRSLDKLISQAKLNFSSYEISRVYSVCPSKTRRYLIAFKTTVRFDLDLEKTALSIKKIPNTEKYEVLAPPISMDENVAAKPYAQKAWVLNGSLLVNDEAEAEKQKDHIAAYSLYLASKKLGSKELTSLFEERIKILVNGLSIGMGKEIKQSDITVIFQKSDTATYKEPKLALCKQGDLTW